jgi:quinol-cytochrome oxidoreductase complex cytochrome b subunit
MLKNKIAIIFIFMLLVLGACGMETKQQQEYRKCISVCAAVLSDDFVTLELCRQECGKKFLGNAT